MIQPERYSIPQLARLWGVDSDQIELFGLEGLTIQCVPVGGKEVRFVAAEGAGRFAAERLAPVEPRVKAMRSDERETWRQLVAFLLPYYTGDGPEREKPHAIAALILKDSEAGGLDFLKRSDDTLASFVRKALDLRAHTAPRKKMRPVLSAAQARAIERRRTALAPIERAESKYLLKSPKGSGGPTEGAECF